MSAKQGFEQHVLLHQTWPPPHCCLCNHEAKITELEAEIRRLREARCQHDNWRERWQQAERDLAAHRAVVRELAETLEESDEPGQAQEEECACWRARKDAALAHPLVQQAWDQRLA